MKLLGDGELNIDVAFLGVPCSDEFGNANGTQGKSCCGSLGYAMVDAHFARKVVLLTEELVPFPNMPASPVQDQVDYIVQVESVGDPAKISVGAARVTSNPRELMIARYAADVIEHSGYFKPGFLDADRLRRGGDRLHPLYGREDGAQRREGALRPWRYHRQPGGFAREGAHRKAARHPVL